MELTEIEQKIVNFLFCRNEKLTSYKIAKEVKIHIRTCHFAVNRLSNVGLLVSEFIDENFGKTVYGYNYK